ncbi:MAG: rhomboid family intramembrane serine protease [Acidobacteriota bacterium]|nr:rhomboid family intramembrane serine protease [Acidobacteriota bacterium]
MLPIGDENPTRRLAWLTWILIAANFAVFALEVWRSGSIISPADAQAMHGIFQKFGLIPARLLGGSGGFPGWLSGDGLVPLLTSPFLHASLMHLLGNMLYLWIFGDNIEDSMGHGRFLAFYFVCATVAALSQTLANPQSIVPMIGASGAVSGILGAYCIRFPRAKVLVLFYFFFFARVVRVPAFILLGLWFFVQLVLAANGGGGVAWHAHLGGFVCGALLLHLFLPARRRSRR